MTFEILSDKGNEVAEQFNLVHGLSESLRELYVELGADLSRFNGDDTWTLPLPARYIIDTDRTIRYADVNADYTHRPEPSETLEALQGIS